MRARASCHRDRGSVCIYDGGNGGVGGGGGMQQAKRPETLN